jgi:hypothetical protein
VIETGDLGAARPPSGWSRIISDREDEAHQARCRILSRLGGWSFDDDLAKAVVCSSTSAVLATAGSGIAELIALGKAAA